LNKLILVSKLMIPISCILLINAHIALAAATAV
jgi:hypothetical protein